jgi:Na+/H+ antiporter NhaA
MAVPALVYLLVAGAGSGLAYGWAIPAATDIAFAIGVLALLGPRAPASLKLFLTSVAIVDDLGAVAIIAFAYTRAIDGVALAAAAAIWLVMYWMGRRGTARLWPYLILAAGLWYAVLLSGVHATIAGVLAAAAIPVVATPGAPDDAGSPLHRLEHALAPWVAFVIVPLFGFANAGVGLAGIGLAQLLAPLPLAVAAGLFAGKQIGIFGAVWLCARTGIAARLRGATWLQIYAVSLLCGIGFTMSLFIGALAFPGRPELIEEAKLGDPALRAAPCRAGAGERADRRGDRDRRRRAHRVNGLQSSGASAPPSSGSGRGPGSAGTGAPLSPSLRGRLPRRLLRRPLRAAARWAATIRNRFARSSCQVAIGALRLRYGEARAALKR